MRNKMMRNTKAAGVILTLVLTISSAPYPTMAASDPAKDSAVSQTQIMGEESATKVIYLDKKSGDDKNDGFTEKTAVKTLSQAAKLLGSNQIIVLCSDSTITKDEKSKLSESVKSMTVKEYKDSLKHSETISGSSTDDSAKETGATYESTGKDDPKTDESKNPKTEDSKKDDKDSKTEDSKTEESKVDKSQTEESQKDKSQKEDPETDKSKKDESKNKDSKNNESKNDDSKNDESKNDESKKDESKNEDSETDKPKKKESKNGDSKTDDSKMEESKTDDSKIEDSKINDSQNNEAKKEDKDSKVREQKMDESETSNHGLPLRTFSPLRAVVSNNSDENVMPVEEKSEDDTNETDLDQNQPANSNDDQNLKTAENNDDGDSDSEDGFIGHSIVGNTEDFYRKTDKEKLSTASTEDSIDNADSSKADMQNSDSDESSQKGQDDTKKPSGQSNSKTTKPKTTKPKTTEPKIKTAAVTTPGAVKTADNSQILPLTVVSVLSMLTGLTFAGLKIKNRRRQTESSMDE
ncbi:hypothetical protein INP51_08045 [Blautia liquoris]|uniref:Uncharacterized protein n=1 Tax=Blautia liquoris TaxID=2779518 RepID=A0A7M2RNA2_9FIRM|nr:hypothetical protein [Blautia liquoris]QOV20852.1 hypothetical protein INP51_08045 [Blautia liquoris]